jgi:hypothetical protein
MADEITLSEFASLVKHGGGLPSGTTPTNHRYQQNPQFSEPMVALLDAIDTVYLDDDNPTSNWVRKKKKM